MKKKQKKRLMLLLILVGIVAGIFFVRGCGMPLFYRSSWGYHHGGGRW